MGATEYRRFDPLRIWESFAAPDEAEPPVRRRSFRPTPAEVVRLPHQETVPRDSAMCRERTRAELAEIAFSFKSRDATRRAWMAARCANCRRCADMVG